MKALFFASVRERVGLAEEEISPPQSVVTVADLIVWMASRGDNYAQAFSHARSVRAALDKTHAPPTAPIGAAREVAFFPPMTGG